MEFLSKEGLTYFWSKLKTRFDNLTSATNTNTSEIAVQKARIDSFVSLPSGSTTGDAELMDIRVGADGITYQSAGDAVRSQDASLKFQIVNHNSWNIIDGSKWTDRVFRGITFTKNMDGTYTVTGTASDSAVNYLCGSTDSFPTGMFPGKSYKLRYNGTVTALSVMQYTGDTLISSEYYREDNQTITIDSQATGTLIRLFVSKNATVNETVSPVILTVPSNKDLEDNAKDMNDILVPTAEQTNISANNIYDYNAANLLPYGEDKTVLGITFTWNTDGSCTVDGANSSTSASTCFLVGATNTPVTPQWLIAGKKYKVRYSSVNVTLRFSFYNGGAVSSNSDFKQNGELTIPQNITGVTVLLRVPTNTTVNNETVKPALLSAATNADLESIISLAFGLSPVNNPNVTSNSDLNTFLTAGQWRVPTAAVANSLLHKPTEFSSTGLLTVFNTHNTNHVYQLIATNSYTDIWIRHIRIDEEQYDEWKSITYSNVQRRAWSADSFLLHGPQDESNAVVAALAEISVSAESSRIWGLHSAGTLEEGTLRNITSDTIYELWDALQAKYPDYIEPGETIGYSLNPSGTNYRPVIAYYIHPRLTYGSNTSIDYDDLPTIYITAGTHGVEGSPTWNLFAIFQRAFMTGTIYSDFLNGRKFRVVPCLDRWSYDHYKRYLAAAYNSDGTQKVTDTELPDYDANRQCICSDNTNPSYATLTMHSYATEARALVDYMQTNGFATNQGDCYIDLHNCSSSLGYLTAEKRETRVQFNIMIDMLAKDWLANTTWSNGDQVDYYNTSVDNHFALQGKICARENIETSFAWFFGKAYNPETACLLEVQQTDDASCAPYAIAKGLDITYRWFKKMLS